MENGEWDVIFAAQYISLTLFFPQHSILFLLFGQSQIRMLIKAVDAKVCFFTGSQLPHLAVLGNPVSELCGLSWCKQMVSALMTNFWSYPDRDSDCQMGFSSSTEVTRLKWFEICGMYIKAKVRFPVRSSI